MTDKKVLNPWDAANGFTMWYDDTLWLPFMEDENCNITGPGHQDKTAFAALVNHYDSYASGEDLSDEWGPEDIFHGWAVSYENEYGEYYFYPCKKDEPGAVPVTTLWGAR